MLASSYPINWRHKQKSVDSGLSQNISILFSTTFCKLFVVIINKFNPLKQRCSTARFDGVSTWHTKRLVCVCMCGYFFFLVKNDARFWPENFDRQHNTSSLQNLNLTKTQIWLKASSTLHPKTMTKPLTYCSSSSSPLCVVVLFVVVFRVFVFHNRIQPKKKPNNNKNQATSFLE